MNELRCELTGDTMTVLVHGVIGGDVLGAELARIIDGCDPEKVRELVFDIYSPGGDVWDGNLVTAKMREAQEKGIRTRAKVYTAASMATILAVSAERAEMAANGRWLIHNPWTVAVGDGAELEKQAALLRDVEREAAELYAQTTGATVDEMLALMAEERWLPASEALSLGFVDAIIPGTDPAAYADARASILAVAGLPPMVAQMFAVEETPADVPPADDHADGSTPAVDATGGAAAADGDAAAGAAATDATQGDTAGGPAMVSQDVYAAAVARIAELTTENAALAGQVAAARAECDRKEMALQDLQRRLRAFSPATAGTDEDRAAVAGQGDAAAYWQHVRELKAGGLTDQEAHLEAARRWPDDHRAMVKQATKNRIR